MTVLNHFLDNHLKLLSQPEQTKTAKKLIKEFSETGSPSTQNGSKRRKEKVETNIADESSEEKPNKKPKRTRNKRIAEPKVPNEDPKPPIIKEVPVGAPGCLEGKRFVLTGIISLSKQEFTQLILKYGGLVREAVSGKTDYVIVGKSPGETKMAKATQLNKPMITEDALFEMISATKPNEVDESEVLVGGIFKERVVVQRIKEVAKSIEIEF